MTVYLYQNYNYTDLIRTELDPHNLNDIIGNVEDMKQYDMKYLGIFCLLLAVNYCYIKIVNRKKHCILPIHES